MLKNCLKCGAPADPEFWTEECTGKKVIYCSNDECMAEAKADTEEIAICIWNNDNTPPPIVETYNTDAEKKIIKAANAFIDELIFCGDFAEIPSKKFIETEKEWEKISN